MTYIHVDEFAEEYRQTGRWMMDRAEWEFSQGDLMQASEKGWNAAAQFLKALATQRRWGHESHAHLAQVADKLAEELGNPEISTLFNTAEALHANFYQAHRSEASVRSGLDAMQRYLDILEAIPPPETPPRKPYVRQRTFHRTRTSRQASSTQITTPTGILTGESHMTTQALRPQPRFPEPDTEPFWEATKRRELTYQTCDDCDEVVFYPRAHCTGCTSSSLTWNVSAGEGEVYTFSVVMQNYHPAFKDLGPYALAYVDLDEGFRIMTNVVGVDNPIEDVTCGMRVKLTWIDQGEGEIALPVFEPA